MSERDPKDVKLTVMITKADRALLKELSRKKDLSVSHIVCRLIRAEAARDQLDAFIPRPSKRAATLKGGVQS
jgi:hypothetical protein